jgi:hypothetical protein
MIEFFFSGLIGDLFSLFFFLPSSSLSKELPFFYPAFYIAILGLIAAFFLFFIFKLRGFLSRFCLSSIFGFFLFVASLLPNPEPFIAGDFNPVFVALTSLTAWFFLSVTVSSGSPFRGLLIFMSEFALGILLRVPPPLILTAILISFVPAFLALDKSRGFWFWHFFGTFFFMPTLLFILFLKRPDDFYVQCSKCLGNIRPTASFCRYCNSEIEPFLLRSSAIYTAWNFPKYALFRLLFFFLFLPIWFFGQKITPLPPVPEGAVASAGLGRVSVSWTNPLSAAVYRVYHKQSLSEPLSDYVETKENKQLFFPLDSGVYYFAVQTVMSGWWFSPLSELLPAVPLPFEKEDKFLPFLEMVLIPAGRVVCEPEKCGNGAYFLEIDRDFRIGKYPVTQGLWQEITGSNPAFFQDCGLDCPVERVSFNDITGENGFLDKLNKMVGCVGLIEAVGELRYAPVNVPKGCFRIPTLEESEYAHRAGFSGLYYWGNSDRHETVDKYAWYINNSSGLTKPVGQKEPNLWGLYDMSGNVREWVYDDGSESFSRVRGGTGEVDTLGLSVSVAFPPDTGSSSLGFRLFLENK